MTDGADYMVFVTSHLVLGMEVAVIDDLTADVCLADVVAVASALWRFHPILSLIH